MAQERKEVIDALAETIVKIRQGRPLRIAIDGRTASGKTTLADELGSGVGALGRTVIRTSIDGFHRPKVARYAQGRHSPEGYYHDARDLAAIRALLLDPLGPDGDGLYRTASFDLEKDIPIDQPASMAGADEILIVDGTFLQRPELAEGWDIAIFVETAEEVAEQRGINRDAGRSGYPEAIRQLYALRYKPAFALYDGLCSLRERADAIIDNNDLAHPVLRLRPEGRLGCL